MSLARVVLLAVITVAPLAAQPAQSGGNGTFYITTYTQATYVIPESTMTVAHRIPFDAGLPLGVSLTADRKRLYVQDAHFERIRVYDLASRALVDSFQLSTGATKVRILGIGIDPRDRFDCYITCFWPAHVPDHYNHAPEWTGKCASAQKDWRNIDLVFP